MPEIELSSMLVEFWRDIQRPDLVWQVLVLVSSLVAAKLFERAVRKRRTEVHGENPALDKLHESTAWKVGHGGLKRLIFPLMALLLIEIARVVLKPFMHVNLLVIAAPLLGSLAAIRFVFFVLRVSFTQSGWLSSFERIFATIVWLAVALHITGFLPDLIALMEDVNFSIGKQKLNLWLLSQGMVTVAGALLVSLWIGGLVETRLMGANGLDNNLRIVFSRLARALLVLVAIMVSLPWVGIDLTALSVFGGAIGVGLGFGLQKIASNYVAGFIILLDRSIRLGNVIAVGADKGKVSQITTRYTVIRNGNGAESLIPNETLIASVVQNENYSDSQARITHAFSIGYAGDPEAALAIMEAAAKAQAGVLAAPEPRAFLMGFADNGVQLELAYWIDTSTDAQSLRSAINRQIWTEFAHAGVRLGNPWAWQSRQRPPGGGGETEEPVEANAPAATPHGPADGGDSGVNSA